LLALIRGNVVYLPIYLFLFSFFAGAVKPIAMAGMFLDSTKESFDSEAVPKTVIRQVLVH